MAKSALVVGVATCLAFRVPGRKCSHVVLLNISTAVRAEPTEVVKPCVK